MSIVSMYLIMLTVFSSIIVLTVKLGERYQEDIFAIFLITIANTALLMLSTAVMFVIFNMVDII